MTDLLSQIEASPVGEFIRTHVWAFPLLETLHFVGLTLLIGAMLIVDLRLLGRLKRVPLTAALGFTHVAAAGLLLNLLSGIAFFVTDPFNYASNPAFKVKLVLVAMALGNVVFFELFLRKGIHLDPGGAAGDRRIKIVAVASLGLWFAILLLGRLLPQFEGY